MKLAKLSLAAITVASLSASAFAADSLAGMFKEGKVNGTLSAYYFHRSKPNGVGLGSTSAGIIDFGLDLTYKTATFNGFSAGATVQSTHSPFANDAGKAMYIGDEYGSGEVFSEAYVQYANSGAFLKAGRQYICTPLVCGSGSRMTRQSFEGYLLGYTGLPNTTLVAGYVTKFQGRTDGAGNIGTFDNIGAKGDGAYTIYAANTSVPGLKLQAQWAKVTDTVDLYYVQADYAGKAESFSYGLSGQYNKTDYDNAISTKDSGYYGIMGSVGASGLTLTAAYSKIENDADAAYGLGGGADNIFTAGDINSGDDYAAGQKSYKVQVDYKINSAAKAHVYYVKGDKVGSADDYKAYGLGAGYAFDGSLKGLGMTAQYEIRDANAAGIDNDKRFRFKAIYKF